MGVTARAVDAALEATVVGSFSRLGYLARRRLFDWRPLEEFDLSGQVVLITGATSGIGRAAAEQMAGLGASLRFVARDETRARQARDEIVAATGNADVRFALADLTNLEAVRAAVEDFVSEEARLDALVHNAGALSAEYTTGPDGTEATAASQVLAPFLLTAGLEPLLRDAPAGRVIWVTSGGMYSERLDVDALEMGSGDYDGVKAYARAKRAQVALMQSWAEHFGGTRVTAHAMHPGWADTRGVRDSLPGFRRLTRPILRDADQGADTMTWLAAAPAGRIGNGRLWLDRRPRSLHRVPWTRRSDEEAERSRLWRWCQLRTGVVPGRWVPAS